MVPHPGRVQAALNVNKRLRERKELNRRHATLARAGSALYHERKRYRRLQDQLAGGPQGETSSPRTPATTTEIKRKTPPARERRPPARVSEDATPRLPPSCSPAKKGLPEAGERTTNHAATGNEAAPSTASKAISRGRREEARPVPWFMSGDEAAGSLRHITRGGLRVTGDRLLDVETYCRLLRAHPGFNPIVSGVRIPRNPEPGDAGVAWSDDDVDEDAAGSGDPAVPRGAAQEDDESEDESDHMPISALFDIPISVLFGVRRKSGA
jgi:hypothetical protein